MKILYPTYEWKKRRWWQFWKPKFRKVYHTPVHINCRCVTLAKIEEEDNGNT